MKFMKHIDEISNIYIIAEIGCNHNGDTDLALKMIDSAKENGADAVKFQYFTKDNLFTDEYLNELDKGTVKLENVDKWNTKELGLNNIFEQVDAFTNSSNQLSIFRDHAKNIGIDFGCTPVDIAGANFLKNMGVDFLKLSSMDANNTKFLESCISTNLPIIVSTGMADLPEIDNIYQTFMRNSYNNYALLHCVSIYPPRDEIINLNFITTLRNMYDCEIGFSDHSLGCEIAIASIAKGARIIEKHYTLDKNMPGWDHKVSADEEELKYLTDGCKKVFRALGESFKSLSAEELEKRGKFRRSLTLKCDVKKGEKLTSEMIMYKRPGTGLMPSEEKFVLGRSFNDSYSVDTTLTLEHFD